MEVLQGGQSSFHVQTTLISVLCSKLELRSEYFGIYCRNGLSFHTTEDVLLKTKDSLLQTEDVLLKSKDGL